MSAVPIRRRPDRRVFAILTATVILAAAVLGAWAAAELAFGSGEIAALTQAGTQSWNSPAVITAGSVLLILGLILLVAALKPGRSWFTDLRRDDTAARSRAVVTTKGLARLASAEASRVDGCSKASATVGSRRITVTAHTVSPDTGSTQTQVRNSIWRRLEELQPTSIKRVRVRLRQKEPS